jgi:hypothetical protein
LPPPNPARIFLEHGKSRQRMDSAYLLNVVKLTYGTGWEADGRERGKREVRKMASPFFFYPLGYPDTKKG